MALKIPTLTCKATKRDGSICGHQWVPRIEPKMCPRCKGNYKGNGLAKKS